MRVFLLVNDYLSKLKIAIPVLLHDSHLKIFIQLFDVGAILKRKLKNFIDVFIIDRFDADRFHYLYDIDMKGKDYMFSLMQTTHIIMWGMIIIDNDDTCHKSTVWAG